MQTRRKLIDTITRINGLSPHIDYELDPDIKAMNPYLTIKHSVEKYFSKNDQKITETK